MTTVHAERVPVADFTDGVRDGGFPGGLGPDRTTEENGVFLMEKTFRTPTNRNAANSAAAVEWMHPIQPGLGETVELRVDLLEVSGPSAIAGLEANAFGSQGYLIYALLVSGDWVSLVKTRFTGPTAASHTETRFFEFPAPENYHNSTLSLSLTRLDRFELMIRTRILDREDGSVLFDERVVDGPDADPALLDSTHRDVVADPGRPWSALDRAALFLGENTDGEQPPVSASFANFTYEKSQRDFSGIEQAIRLSWPAYADKQFAVEGASSVQGPWNLVDEPVVTEIGMSYMTIPMRGREGLEVFRLTEMAN